MDGNRFENKVNETERKQIKAKKITRERKNKSERINHITPE